MIKQKYLFFDCETGGLDCKKHPLLTVFFGVYDRDFNLIDELYLQLKPENTANMIVEPSAMKVTGIDMSQHLSDPNTVTYEEGQKKLLSLLERNKTKGLRIHYTPAGHNLQFDLNFIFSQLIEESAWRKYAHYKYLDTFRLTNFLQDAGVLPKDLGNLGSLVEYFGLPMRDAHHAKEDIKMTVDVFKELQNMLKRIKNSADSNDVSSSLLKIVER